LITLMVTPTKHGLFQIKIGTGFGVKLITQLRAQENPNLKRSMLLIASEELASLVPIEQYINVMFVEGFISVMKEALLKCLSLNLKTPVKQS